MSDEQVEMIDSKLYKRYEDVTKTKIEKTIGTDEFKLTPSEFNILLKNINEFDFNKLSNGNVANLLRYAPDKNNMADLIIQKKQELTHDNVSILLQYATDKDKMAEHLQIKIDNISKLTNNDIINLLQSATDKDKMAELLIKYKTKLHGADGWSSSIGSFLVAAKTKDKIAELIIEKEKELSSLHLVHHDDIEDLLYYPNDTEKIAALLGTDNIDRLEDNNVKFLIKKLGGNPLKLEIIAKILGEENISKLSYDSVKDLFVQLYIKEKSIASIAKILNQYHAKKTPQIQKLINKHLKTKTPPK